MQNPALDALAEELATLDAIWSGALPAFGAVAQLGAGEQVECMSDTGLVEVTDAIASFVRHGMALLTAPAAEIAKRSARERGTQGLARKLGFANATQLIAASMRGRAADAAKVLAVGKACAAGQTISGEWLPPTHPHVARSIASGAISLDAASAITGMLDRVGVRGNPVKAEKTERVLATLALTLPYDLLLKAIARAEARLDPDGVLINEAEARARRACTIRNDSYGMTHLRAVLDPESAAAVKAAIEGIVTHWIRTNTAECTNAADAPEGGGPAVAGTGPGVIGDGRTIPQMQADALALIARHALGCRRMPEAPAMSIVARVEMHTLVDGLGVATIDGLAQPVSAGTIRRMAATAELIPAVFGGASLPLDLGRDKRLFSRAQRLALAERDGGCASCGLDVAYCEAHHILWSKRDHGRTDLSNGVMLCPPCHTRIHHDGWIIKIINSQVWFQPPPHVDPQQTWRLGGRARFDPAAA
ncbi:DUF222 domain-containing protein [Rathayibacter sp. YIM 133350]|uniref:HNH endonuclease signature motif containing protein n=1 Tax=Rathayibacter sp. YIM 133350 TaxID=3131992 RepID=UPI00307FA3CF